MTTTHYAGNGQHTNSYYAASANPAPTRPMLSGQHTVDIAVIGAGFTGLSTALHLAEQGYQVALIEGAKIGWGASGRNGGQIVNGLNASLQKIHQRYGKQTATQVAGMVQEGGRIIRDRVAQYNIQCDLKETNIFAAHTKAHMRDLEAMQALWRSYGMDDFTLLDKTDMLHHVSSDNYVGGMLDNTGGHIHPLNLALGEAAAFESLGGKIYESSRVNHVDLEATQPLIRTDQGEMRCKTLILCGNAYLGHAVKPLVDRVMPVSTQIIATEPLGEERAKSLLPSDACIEDCRYILDYYRLSADKRLLFGGGTVYGGTDPSDIRAKLSPNMLKVFPELKDVNIDYAWSGNFALSFTRVPQMGKLNDNVYFAHGYSGHGVTGSHLFGRILSEAIMGELERFDVFAKLPWYSFPGGRRFRAQYSTLGSWWYSLRDKLGV